MNMFHAYWRFEHFDEKGVVVLQGYSRNFSLTRFCGLILSAVLIQSFKDSGGTILATRCVATR